MTREDKDNADINVPDTMQLNDDTLLEQTDPPSVHSTNAFSLACALMSAIPRLRTWTHGRTNDAIYFAGHISPSKLVCAYNGSLAPRSPRIDRTRTVERSTLQLQALIDQMPTADSTLAERLLFAHSIPLPSKWAMEKELADRFLSIGVVKSALEIYERLRYCPRLVAGRKAEADVVLARGRPPRHRLAEYVWTPREKQSYGACSEISILRRPSNTTTVRGKCPARHLLALHELLGVLFRPGEYSQAIPFLKRATALQPLLSRPWFLMGCAYVREEAWVEARDAFARCVGIDQEDGESWNNIASVYLRMDEKGLAGGDDLTLLEGDLTPKSRTDNKFTNKLLAFRALKQGLRYSYENWRMWQNYIIVSVDVGELSEACRALGRLVELRVEKDGLASVDIEVLERLVDAVTRAPPDEEPIDAQSERVRNPDEGHGLFPRVYDLFTRVVLSRISNSARIYRAWARLLTWRARSRNANDVERFKEGVVEVTELVDVLRNLGPRARDGEIEEGKNRELWKFQAKSLVRTFMGRTKASFEDEPEWAKLKELLDELKNE
ncbi:TPR-like protein [Rhizoctonia solani]|uniref:TPR-like protein n=1 Tax=Rhizoctonia solani TaxID=456999 RepID=A0A8H7LZS1_9AGAM|nr:TPR-like protein [Rhizoctonia solani]